MIWPIHYSKRYGYYLDHHHGVAGTEAVAAAVVGVVFWVALVLLGLSCLFSGPIIMAGIDTICDYYV